MKNLTTLCAVVLLVGCGGGGKSKPASETSLIEESEPIEVTMSARIIQEREQVLKDAFANIGFDIKWASVVGKGSMPFISFDINLPVEELDLYDPISRTYDVGFWAKFSIITDTGKEMLTPVLNTATSRRKSLDSIILPDVGSCIEVKGGIIRCNLMYISVTPVGEPVSAKFTSGTHNVQVKINKIVGS